MHPEVSMQLSQQGLHQQPAASQLQHQALAALHESTNDKPMPQQPVASQQQQTVSQTAVSEHPDVHLQSAENQLGQMNSADVPRHLHAHPMPAQVAAASASVLPQQAALIPLPMQTQIPVEDQPGSVQPDRGLLGDALQLQQQAARTPEFSQQAGLAAQDKLAVQLPSDDTSEQTKKLSGKVHKCSYP